MIVCIFTTNHVLCKNNKRNTVNEGLNETAGARRYGGAGCGIAAVEAGVRWLADTTHRPFVPGNPPSSACV